MAKRIVDKPKGRPSRPGTTFTQEQTTLLMKLVNNRWMMEKRVAEADRNESLIAALKELSDHLSEYEVRCYKHQQSLEKRAQQGTPATAT